MEHRRLIKLLWLAIAAAVATITLKTTAWLLTDSVGLLSDAAESVVNLVAAVVAMLAMRWALKPADEEHAYGHQKAEYFAAGVEGAMIVVAAVIIGATALPRLFDPQPIEAAGLGVAISTGASLINLAVGALLLREGRRLRSIILEADGKHLLTDVWTSVGVLGAVDPRRADGLEHPGPADRPRRRRQHHRHRPAARAPLDRRPDGPRPRCRRAGADRRGAHALRERRHPLSRTPHPPGRVARVRLPARARPRRLDRAAGHDVAEEIEDALRAALPHATVFTHLEPAEDPRSFADVELDRLDHPQRGLELGAGVPFQQP